MDESGILACLVVVGLILTGVVIEFVIQGLNKKPEDSNNKRPNNKKKSSW